MMDRQIRSNYRKQGLLESGFRFRHGDEKHQFYFGPKGMLPRYTSGRLQLRLFIVSTYLQYDIMNTWVCVRNNGGICTKWWWGNLQKLHGVCASFDKMLMHLEHMPSPDLWLGMTVGSDPHGSDRGEFYVQFVLIPTLSHFCTMVRWKRTRPAIQKMVWWQWFDTSSTRDQVDISTWRNFWITDVKILAHPTYDHTRAILQKYGQTSPQKGAQWFARSER